MAQWTSPSPSTLHKLSSLSSSLTYTVGPLLTILWHSGPIPRHLMTQWAYIPSSYGTVDITLAIYSTQSVQPQFFPYLHNGPIPPHFMTQWAYTPSFLYSGHPPCHRLYTNYPASVLPLLTEWAHTSSFYDTVGLYPLILWHSGHPPYNLLYTNCPASVLPLLTQWAHYLPFYDTVGPYLVI